MFEGLLKTKLFPPPSRSNQVKRQTLLEKLTLARQREVSCTLVSAPAGFGKTTLLVDYARTSCLSFAWLSLDESDRCQYCRADSLDSDHGHFYEAL